MGGEALGGWGRGRRDWRTLLYALLGLISWLLRPPLFAKAGDIPFTSLSPRLWLAYPLDTVEDSVLVRLSSKAPEEVEYAVEAVDAFEGWRFVVEYSAVNVCWRGWRYDIPVSRKPLGNQLKCSAVRNQQTSSTIPCTYGR